MFRNILDNILKFEIDSDTTQEIEISCRKMENNLFSTTSWCTIYTKAKKTVRYRLQNFYLGRIEPEDIISEYRSGGSYHFTLRV